MEKEGGWGEGGGGGKEEEERRKEKRLGFLRERLRWVYFKLNYSLNHNFILIVNQLCFLVVFLFLTHHCHDIMLFLKQTQTQLI